MDETLQSSSTESMSKNCSCFTCCSGSSNKKLSKDMKPAASNPKKNKTTSSLTFFSSFCANKSAVETNLVKTAVSEKPNRGSKDFTHSPNLDKQISQQKNNKQAARIISKTNFPAPAPGDNNSKVHNHKKKNSEIDKDKLSEKNSKFHQSILLVKDANGKNPKKEKKRSRSSSLVPLQVENNIVATKNSTRVLSHSISLPPLNRKKENTIRAGENDSDNGGGKVDPIVGMSIMMGTLAIMLIWGKLCAILCTCAWLYMVPRLRIKQNITISSLDFESPEYKKKVVLEGLLQRDRRH